MRIAQRSFGRSWNGHYRCQFSRARSDFFSPSMAHTSRLWLAQWSSVLVVEVAAATAFAWGDISGSFRAMVDVELGECCGLNIKDYGHL